MGPGRQVRRDEETANGSGWVPQGEGEMAQDAGAHEWVKTETVDTRRFMCEVEEGTGREGDFGESRLRLESNGQGRTRLVILVPPAQVSEVRKELVARGYRGTLPVHVRGRAEGGGWLNYLNEFEMAFIVVEMLGWNLTAEEQAMLDAMHDYARRAPTGFRSPRLVR